MVVHSLVPKAQLHRSSNVTSTSAVAPGTLATAASTTGAGPAEGEEVLNPSSVSTCSAMLQELEPFRMHAFRKMGGGAAEDVRMRVFAFILFVVSAVLLGCAHSPAELRLYCLRQAHVTVKAPEIDSKARETMVREYYLRCLEVHGVPDVPVVTAFPAATDPHAA